MITGRGKSKYTEENPNQCHFVHHKSNMDFLEIEPMTSVTVIH
jgi:hypothetical protein